MGQKIHFEPRGSAVPVEISTELKKDFAHLDARREPFVESLASWAARRAWWGFLKLASRHYFQVELVGSWQDLRRYANLILISNHSSHLDGSMITASMPTDLLQQTYVAVARDYFFSSPLVAKWAQNCLNGIPLDRDKEAAESLSYCMDLMRDISPMWTIVFPEGTRSETGEMGPFRKGVSLMARYSSTPIVFLHVAGAHELWPKGRYVPKQGKVRVTIGPVIEPCKHADLEQRYLRWVSELKTF